MLIVAGDASARPPGCPPASISTTDITGARRSSRRGETRRTGTDDGQLRPRVA